MILQDDRDRIYNEKGVAADMLDFLHAFFEGKCCCAADGPVCSLLMMLAEKVCMGTSHSLGF